MHAVKGSRDSFLLKEWLAADADARTSADASLTAGVSCDDLGCVMQSAGGGLVAQAFRPEALSDDCERAALIVTLRQAPASCAASVIDADRLRRQGAMALRRGREGLVVEAVKPRGIDRPWSPAMADEGDADASVLAPRVVPPRAVDATPAEADLQAEE
jgi:competence protein ComEC